MEFQRTSESMAPIPNLLAFIPSFGTDRHAITSPVGGHVWIAINRTYTATTVIVQQANQDHKTTTEGVEKYVLYIRSEVKGLSTGCDYYSGQAPKGHRPIIR